MKIRPVRAEVFHAEGQTDRQRAITKPVSLHRNYVNAPTAELNCPEAHSNRVNKNSKTNECR